MVQQRLHHRSVHRLYGKVESFRCSRIFEVKIFTESITVLTTSQTAVRLHSFDTGGPLTLLQSSSSQQSTNSVMNGSSQSLPAPPRSPSGPSPLPQQLQQYPLTPQSSEPSLTITTQAQQQPQLPPGVKVEQAATAPLAPQQPQAAIGGQRPPSTAQQTQQQRSTAFPGSLSDLVVSFESVKQKGKSF